MTNWALAARVRVALTGVTATSGNFGYSVAGPGSFAWTIPDASTLNTGRNTTTQIATNVPAGAAFYASPDLLPGQRLELAVDGTTLNMVGDATVPTVDGAASGSAIDAISARDIVIEVIESPSVATIVNVTQGVTYIYGDSYTGRTGSQPANRWNAVMHEANAGDIIEVSPGYVFGTTSDIGSTFSSSLDQCMLAVWKPCTIRGVAGRGRWRVFAGSDYLTSGRSGIIIFSPSEIGVRGDFTISDFELDNFGNAAFGLRMRNNNKVPGVYTYMHSSLTLRNFKIGHPTAITSLSGLSTLSETLTVEDGHIYDCGSFSGLNHNMYISAKTMVLRGLRTERTRGWLGTPYVSGTSNYNMDGHLAKVQAVTGTVEGCAFVCSGLSSPSQLLQMYAGGNWTVRGNLFVDTAACNNANGAITMALEGPLATPNYEWFAGSEGNSLLFERNTYVGHYSRPIIWFFDHTTGSEQALYPAGDTGVAAFRRLSALTVRDNIAAVTSTVPAGGTILSGFPGTNNARWIDYDPNGGTNWAARGNTVRAYNKGAWAFNERELLLYADAAGAPAASTGSQSLPQFLWPHGYRDVTRSTQGLG